MKYYVVHLLGASTGEYVEANTPEEAPDQIFLEGSLCQHCSKKFELHEGGEFIVYDGEGKEVLYEDTEAGRQRQKIAKLEKDIKEIKPYVEMWYNLKATLNDFRSSYHKSQNPYQKFDDFLSIMADVERVKKETKKKGQ